MKNILFLLHIPPPVHGSSVVGQIIKDSRLINSKFKCSYINLLASQNVAESGTINIKKLLGFAVTLYKVLVTLSQKPPNLCYLALTTTGAAFFKDLLLVALLKLFRIKRIYHLHNRGISLHQNKAIYRICYKFVFKNAEVILLSRRLYSDIQSFVPKTNIHICPNGIPFPIQNSEINEMQPKLQIKPSREPGIIKEQGKDSNRIVQILFLSNLIESKGVYNLLEACALLKKKEISFECIFIGGESDISASQFKDRVNQLELNRYVYYQGRKLGKEKEQAYLNADIFVFPTFYSNECFPLVLLEAMSYSLPVISTFEGGIQDIVEDGHTGFLVTQKDVEALANQLENLIKNPRMREQMGMAGRKKYEKEFTLDRFENRLKEILQQVVDKD
jgi:glycosyltransferase involved in cell wall biosynthesis